MLKTHILIQDQQLLKKSALKLTPPLPHSPHRAHSGVAGTYEYGGRLSLLRTITSSQIPIHPHKDRLMFPPSPQTIPQCSNIPSLWAPSPLFHRFSIPKCPAEWCLNRYVWTLIDYRSKTAQIWSYKKIWDFESVI